MNATESEALGGEAVRNWLWRLLACNPFYLASAAVLLFGIYRVSLDPTFLAREAGSLEFSFTALQIYELLLVGTAVFLSRRQVWYDSTLLVFLENLLVLVPFILISRALFLEVNHGEAVWICALGAGLATVRFGGLRRYLRLLNLPAALLAGGGVVLAVNLALPFLFKAALVAHRGTLPLWQHWAWVGVLPAVAGSALFFPRPRHWGGLPPQRSWWPIVFLGLWIVATGVHLWCLGYIYDLRLQLYFLAPTLWLSGWILYYRQTDFQPVAMPQFDLVLTWPVLASLLAGTYKDSSIFLR